MLPPPAAGLGHLAKSPASMALASEFFARERQRAAAEPSVTLKRAPVLELPEWSSSLGDAFQLNKYHPLDEMYAFLDALAATHKHVKVFTIGRTAEGRAIKALELVNNATEPDFVWLDALTHAREWITGSTMLYIIDQLAAGPRDGRQRASELFRKNYIIVPVVNPDGYVYTWTTNRMWRKNRSRARTRTPDNKCIGVSTWHDGRARRHRTSGPATH